MPVNSRRFFFVLWLLALQSFMLAPSALFAQTDQPPPAIVSFTFDDASLTQYNYAFELSRKYGIVATLFVPTESVDIRERGEGHNWTMNWRQIREISAAGWEIGSHSRTHGHLTQQSDDEVMDELAGSKLEITQQTGIEPVSFSSPFGDFNDAAIERIMTFYDYNVSWLGHQGRNPVMSVEPRYIGRLEVTNDMSVEQVCGEMVRAAEADTWLVLLFHGIMKNNTGNNGISVEVLDQIYACAALLDARGVIRIETVRDGGRIVEQRRRGRLERP